LFPRDFFAVWLAGACFGLLLIDGDKASCCVVEAMLYRHPRDIGLWCLHMALTIFLHVDVNYLPVLREAKASHCVESGNIGSA
jgi:hypothetical protein